MYLGLYIISINDTKNLLLFLLLYIKYQIKIKLYNNRNYNFKNIIKLKRN